MVMEEGSGIYTEVHQGVQHEDGPHSFILDWQNSHQPGNRIPPAKFIKVRYAKQMHASFNSFIGF